MIKKKSIFQLLTEKPWEKNQIEADNEHQGQTVTFPKNKPVKPPFKKVTIKPSENNIGKDS